MTKQREFVQQMLNKFDQEFIGFAAPGADWPQDDLISDQVVQLITDQLEITLNMINYRGIAQDYDPMIG